MVTTLSDTPNSAPKILLLRTVGYWNNDTNPVTAIQVAASTGNITSGSCTLYGINNSGGSQVSISGLTAATTTNSIDNVNYAQTWTWNSLSSGNALTLSSNSATSGQVLDVARLQRGLDRLCGVFQPVRNRRELQPRGDERQHRRGLWRLWQTSPGRPNRLSQDISVIR